MKILLAGPSGVGKTTVAKILAKRLGARYVEVLTDECRRLSDPVKRQICFFDVVGRGVIDAKGFPFDLVLDNAMLSVYGYTMAIARDTMVGRSAAWIEWAKWEAENFRVVLLIVKSRKVLAERIAKRQRKTDPYENKLRIHMSAQRYMVTLARRLGIPIVDTTEKTPEGVAEEVLKRLT